MKHIKLETMTYGWQELIKKVPELPPKGYSNVDEIAKKSGICVRYANETLHRLYKQGKIDRVLIKDKGKLKYYYKD